MHTLFWGTPPPFLGSGYQAIWHILDAPVYRRYLPQMYTILPQLGVCFHIKMPWLFPELCHRS